MPGQETRSIVASYDIQHYLKFSGGSSYIKVTEINSFDVEREANAYEPEYIDKKTQPTYNLGRTDTIDFEVDAFGPGGAQQEFAKHEDDQNVAVDYVRTCAYDFENGEPASPDALVAKHATAILNMNPLAQKAGSPARMTGTIVIDSDYDKGTFAESTGTYTPTPAE